MSEAHRHRPKVICFFLILSALLLTACDAGRKEAGGIIERNYREAPMLTALVKTGKLPPVGDRLPRQPLVKKTVADIGTYGGTMEVLASSLGPYNDMQGGLEGANLFRVAEDGVSTLPNLAESYSFSEEKDVLTIHLREGVKWSNGEPFTAEDIRFMFEDMHFNEAVRTWNGASSVEKVKLIDDYTIQLKVPEGQASLPMDLAGWGGGRVSGYAPSHYLKKWHKKYNPDAQKIGASEGYAKWEDALWSHYWWDPQSDLEVPTLRPWILKGSEDWSNLYERNPYYWAVDEEGNQLPYIDRIAVRVENKNIYLEGILNGKSDMAYTDTDIADLERYRKLEESGDFRLILWPGSAAADFTLEVNQFHPDEVYGGMLQDLRFRRALSLAIDRDEINGLFYNGLAVPGQLSVLPSSTFYKKEWSESFARYNPEEAERLLDEMGVKHPDKGNRKTPDGFPFLLRVDYSRPSLTPVMELIREYWQSIGINTNIYLQNSEDLSERAKAKNFMVMADTTQYGDERTLFRGEYLWDSWATRPWWRWNQMKRKAAIEHFGKPLPKDWRERKTPDDGKLEGEKPPEFFIKFLKARDDWLKSTPGSEEYRELAETVFDMYSKALWSIGTVGRMPTPWLVRNTIGNIPEPGSIAGMPLDNLLVMSFADQFYIKSEN